MNADGGGRPAHQWREPPRVVARRKGDRVRRRRARRMSAAGASLQARWPSGRSASTARGGDSRRRPDTQAGRRMAAELHTRAGSIPTDPHTGSAWPTPTAGTAAGSREGSQPAWSAMAARLPSPRTAASVSCGPMEHGGAGSPRRSGPVWEPRGSRLAYRCGPVADVGGSETSALCVVRADGHSRHVVARVSSSTTPACVSPHGRRLSYATPDGVFVVGADEAGGSGLLASHGGSRSAASPGRLPAESSSARRCVTTTWRFRRSPPTARA